jgi:UDP-N-acetylglucosamine--N-acetylmuramyl-(pentapeptide) pyrophosphoryl-undecaprenol N-acetylglucosamine transferase
MTSPQEAWIACGGTGGHFLPGVVMGRALRAEGFAVQYFGEGKSIEQHLSLDHNIDLKRPPCGSRFNRFFKLKSSFNAQRKINPPSFVLLFGGFSSFALGLWALMHGIPIFIFEQNAIAGRVNRFLSWFAQGAFLTFPLKGRPLRCKTHLTGNPVRHKVHRSGEGWDLLVLGGSQGALALNRTLPQLLPKDNKILHLCGPGRTKEATDAYGGRANVEVRESDRDVPGLLSKSRWVISRAGATSLSEIISAKVAAITVPYPFAKDNHQRANAKHLQSIGACEYLEEAELLAKKDWLHSLLKDEQHRDAIIQAQEESNIADVHGQRAMDVLKSTWKQAPIFPK